MASLKQIEANRLNSQKSTGPRTPEGKAAVRFNALKLGIDAQVLVIPGEDQDELHTLALEYYAQFRPETPVARYLVDTLIHCDWNRRRLSRLQANIIRSLSGEEVTDRFARADRAALGSGPLDRVFRQLNALERHYFRALAELRRQPEQPPVEEIGFVPPEMLDQPAVGQAAVGHAAVEQVSLGQVSVEQAALGQAAVGQVSVGQVVNLRPVANRPTPAPKPPHPPIGFVPPLPRRSETGSIANRGASRAPLGPVGEYRGAIEFGASSRLGSAG